MPVLEFAKVKYLLLYIPGDKGREFQPFLTYPVEYTSFSQDIYEKLLKELEDYEKNEKGKISNIHGDTVFTNIIINQ